MSLFPVFLYWFLVDNSLFLCWPPTRLAFFSLPFIYALLSSFVAASVRSGEPLKTRVCFRYPAVDLPVANNRVTAPVLLRSRFVLFLLFFFKNLFRCCNTHARVIFSLSMRACSSFSFPSYLSNGVKKSRCTRLSFYRPYSIVICHRVFLCVINDYSAKSAYVISVPSG